MSNYKLTYFDIDGGRAEPARIALHAAGLAYQDVRWSFPEFGEKRTAAPFHAVPFIEMDGKVVTQSNAISRYVGKMCNLYPDDPLQALYCDEVLDALEDLNHYVVQTFGLEGDELKQAREVLMNGRLTVFLKGLNGLLARGGGNYFADQCLTIADLKMATMLKMLRSGNLDHIPADFVDNLSPALAAHQERVHKEPIVQAYYASRSA
ncbi:MAG: glutathione S-transferase family protein [Gammaproteobacteria bacterium]|nr:glutathione S-transferase family protein [Gammaproteobacteria bacterium]